MDAQSVIDTATAANAAALGNPLATEYFRGAVKGAYCVTVNLKPAEKEYLRRMLPFGIIFTNTLTITHDHAIIAALRQLARDILDRNFQILHTTTRTLIVGSAMREISRYADNDFVHHYVHASEVKDVDRIVRPALCEIASRLKAKAGKTDRRVFQEPVEVLKTKKDTLRKPAKRYVDIMHILADYQTASKLPPNIHTEPVEATTLVFEDSLYNFTSTELVDLFNKTGAIVAYGYGFYPMELVFPEMPPHKLYEFSAAGSMASITFRGGSSNGYIHRISTWSLIYKNPVITSRGTTLVVEIVARMGPMCVFKIMRATHEEHIVRSIGLTESESYVKILDLEKMYDFETGKLMTPLVYVSVRADEFYDAVNYIFGIDAKSHTFTNTMSYVLRRMGGMSLVTRELIMAWDLTKKDCMNFCLVVIIYVRILMGTLMQITDPDNIEFAGILAKIKSKVINWARATLIDRLGTLAYLLIKHRLHEELVLTPDNTRVQLGYVRKRLQQRAAFLKNKPMYNDDIPQTQIIKEAIMGVPRGAVNTSLYMEFRNEEDMPSCQICCEVHGKMGQQVMKCNAKDDSYHMFKLNEDQRANLRAKLLDTDNDPEGLAKVKKRALDAMPKVPFSIRAKVKYIRAGPRCGKSHMIRLLADENNMVASPFAKLKPVYEGLIGVNGDKYDLVFKTTHRAVATTGRRRIFVDEFTSFSYDMLACTVFNNTTEEVFLVGDERQTRIQEPDEGLYIGKYIDLTKLDTHELLVNFRNPPDTVALLNKLFGYEMRAAKEYTEPSIVHMSMTEANVPDNSLRMCFSKAASTTITEKDTNTIRSNQGGTYPITVVYATAQDAALVDIPCLQVVGLSRQTEKLYVVTDTSEAGQRFKQFTTVDQDWETSHVKFLKFADMPKPQPSKSDVITDVLGGTDSTAPWSTDSEDGVICRKATMICQKKTLVNPTVKKPASPVNDVSSTDSEDERLVANLRKHIRGGVVDPDVVSEVSVTELHDLKMDQIGSVIVSNENIEDVMRSDQHRFEVLFCHCISADLGAPGNMSAGVATVFGATV